MEQFRYLGQFLLRLIPDRGLFYRAQQQLGQFEHIHPEENLHYECSSEKSESHIHITPCWIGDPGKMQLLKQHYRRQFHEF